MEDRGDIIIVYYLFFSCIEKCWRWVVPNRCRSLYGEMIVLNTDVAQDFRVCLIRCVENEVNMMYEWLCDRVTLCLEQ